MKRYYKKIDSTLELKNFDDLAAADGAVAVGVSNSGSLYKWNRESRRAEKINNSEAADILQVGAAEIEAIITHRGAYEILEPVEKEETQEPTKLEVNTPTEEVVEAVAQVEPKECEKTHYDDLVDLIKALHEEVKVLKLELSAEAVDLKGKVNSLEETVTELKNFIILE